MTVNDADTDTDAATDDAYPDAINTPPHSPKSATDPDADATTAEDKTSVRQLIDGKEYPVAKVDIIKKGFDCKAAVELCVAYLHGLSQLLGCPRYTF